MHLLALVAGVLVVSPGRIQIQLNEPTYGVPVVATCDANVQVHPASPFAATTLGPCENRVTLFWSETLVQPGVYNLAIVDGCPPIATYCFGIEDQCDVVATKTTTWTDAKRLYR